MFLHFLDACRHYLKARKLRRQLMLAGWKVRELEIQNIDPDFKEAAAAHERRKAEEAVKSFLDS